jgi:hypothetical protein
MEGGGKAGRFAYGGGRQSGTLRLPRGKAKRDASLTEGEGKAGRFAYRGGGQSGDASLTEEGEAKRGRFAYGGGEAKRQRSKTA